MTKPFIMKISAVLQRIDDLLVQIVYPYSKQLAAWCEQTPHSKRLEVYEEILPTLGQAADRILQSSSQSNDIREIYTIWVTLDNWKKAIEDHPCEYYLMINDLLFSACTLEQFLLTPVITSLGVPYILLSPKQVEDL